jgi:hypothetical protein
VSGIVGCGSAPSRCGPPSPAFRQSPASRNRGNDPLMIWDTSSDAGFLLKWNAWHVGSRNERLRSRLQGCKGGINAQANLQLAGSAVRIYLAGRRARPIARKASAGCFRPRRPGACFVWACARQECRAHARLWPHAGRPQCRERRAWTCLLRSGTRCDLELHLARPSRLVLRRGARALGHGGADRGRAAQSHRDGAGGSFHPSFTRA